MSTMLVVAILWMVFALVAMAFKEWGWFRMAMILSNLWLVGFAVVGALGGAT